MNSKSSNSKPSNSKSSTFSFARALKGAALAVAFAASAGAAQAAESPFSNLNGSWSGAGVITMANGVKENPRCRATYNVDPSGYNLNLALRCAGDSYKFEFSSSVSHANGAVSGFWNEKIYNVGGTISGNGTPGRIQVRAEGPFSALMAMNTKANQQSISIQSPGSKMQDVAISLNRGK
jgi:hypothetical protein